jgi:hypothetical protein
MNLHLLIIEDDQPIIDNWNERLDFYKIDENAKYTIKPTFVRTLSEAKLLLESRSFDAAVIDIRLESSNPRPNKDGNKLFDIITSTSLAVSAICTGEPGIVELNEQQNVIAKVFEKGDGVVQMVLDWLDEKSSMISSIQKMQKSMDSEMAKVFSRSIWPRWNYWLAEGQDQDFIESALTRHMATHLHASFLNDAVAVHPEEYYFIPSLIKDLDTGDITVVDGKHYILVTPRCEIAQNKNKTFQFVELKDISADIDKIESAINAKQEKIVDLDNDDPVLIQLNKDVDKEKNKRSNLFRHGGNKASLHFLPIINRSDIESFGPFHAQFDHIVFIPKVNQVQLNHFLNGKYASLSNEFVPSLVERLGAYFSRIGTPDYSHPE